jgi:ABC-type glycerol-3-phosphate transport system substrate-binding protein
VSDGSVPEAAWAFIRFLANADAREKWIAAKLALGIIRRREQTEVATPLHRMPRGRIF